MIDEIKSAWHHITKDDLTPDEWEATVSATDLETVDDTTLISLFNQRDPAKDKTSLNNQRVIGRLYTLGLSSYVTEEEKPKADKPQSKMMTAAQIGLVGAAIAVAIISWMQ